MDCLLVAAVHNDIIVSDRERRTEWVTKKCAQNVPFCHPINLVPSVFQNGGNTLCAVDDSNDHVLSVWDWQREDRLAEVKVSSIGRLRHTVTVTCQLNCCVFVFFSFFACWPQCSNESVLGADFHPTDCSIIVTCGKSHLYFWNLEKGVLAKKQGLFEV